MGLMNHRPVSFALLGFAAAALLAVAAAVPGCANSGGDSIFAGLVDLPPTPGEAARDMFNPFDADKRRAAVAALSASHFGGEEEYVRAYRLLITDEDATVRAAVVRALGLHGSVEDVDLLAPRLDDEAEAVRWEAGQALQKIHNPAALPQLTRHTIAQHETSVDVRIACARALGQYAEPRVVDALIGALNDPDFGVVHAARGSLRTLTGQDFGHDAAKWLAWSKENPERLFEQQQQYTWKPFGKPPSTFEKIQFWKDREPVAPRRPVGADADAEEKDDDMAS